MSGNRDKKILIVEDDQLLSLVTEQHVKSLGLLVAGKAASGEEAIKKTAKFKPDLIIMDISLRGPMHGVEAVKEIRKESDVPVIFLSGSSGMYQKEKAKAINNTCFLDKPATKKELERRVLEMLDLTYSSQ